MAWLKTRTEREDASQRTLAPVIPLERRTLAQRLAEGPLGLNEAVRLATDLADALRGLHDEGNAHGNPSPLSIELTPSGVELMPARIQRGLPSPYTAPELLNQQEPDARSDIFAFGATLFEMVTGRWAFEGDTPEALGVALQQQPAPRAGNGALDSLIFNCLSKEPSARPQIRRVQLELKLAGVLARQSADPNRREQLQSFVRSEIQDVLESRIAGKLETQQAALVQFRQTLAASGERMSRVERVLETVDKHAMEFAGTAATQLHALEQTVRAQAAALDAARRALAQTDDLVERVVEALDSLQSIVLDRTEFIPGAMGLHGGLRAVRPISG